MPERALPGAGQKGTGKLKSNPGLTHPTWGAWWAGLSAGVGGKQARGRLVERSSNPGINLPSGSA
jgi:hypothetical protein